MNLNNLNLTELNEQELLEIEGGNGGRRIRRKILEYGLEVLGAFWDTISQGPGEDTNYSA